MRGSEVLLRIFLHRNRGAPRGVRAHRATRLGQGPTASQTPHRRTRARLPGRLVNPVDFGLGDWQRISQYLDEALDLDATAQVRWLEELAAREPRIARTVRDILADREATDSDRFLEHSLLSPAVDEA